MKFDKDKRTAFENAAKPLMEFLAKNCHQNTHVNVTSAIAELSESVCVFNTANKNELLKG